MNEDADGRQWTRIQLIFSVFKTLTDQTVTVELKNDLSITGVLKSVDQYVLIFHTFILTTSRGAHVKGTASRFLNIRLDSIKVLDEARHPHMVSPDTSTTFPHHSLSYPTDLCGNFPSKMAVKNCFIRGSVVRYVQLPPEHVDTQLLEDATRRGMTATFLSFNAFRWTILFSTNLSISHRGG